VPPPPPPRRRCSSPNSSHPCSRGQSTGSPSA
jgi:hypothetical protein